MSLMVVNLCQSARLKFFINTTHMMVTESWNQVFLGSGGQNELDCWQDVQKFRIKGFFRLSRLK